MRGERGCRGCGRGPLQLSCGKQPPPGTGLPAPSTERWAENGAVGRERSGLLGQWRVWKSHLGHSDDSVGGGTKSPRDRQRRHQAQVTSHKLPCWPPAPTIYPAFNGSLQTHLLICTNGLRLTDASVPEGSWQMLGKTATSYFLVL